MELIGNILKKYWGYDAFRFLQEEIIISVLQDKDTLAILPTGGGKSICFQVPAMAKEGLCLVVSPLIALMKDQVENLKKRGVPALSVYSGMTFWEVKMTLQNAINGRFKFLYVSPERLESALFLEYLPALRINLIAVDEAHCVSQWGYDFRPPYLRIAALREHLPGIPVLALTASATKEVQEDICSKLSFKKDHRRFQKSFERPNLSYSVFKVTSKQNKLLEICASVKGSGIVYCRNRKRTKEVSDLLKANGFSSDFYHAGLNNAVRASKQESWIKNEIRIIVCTNAFGMGIDKSDVRFVVHYDIPDALENYYQEAGRAGRDEKKAYAVLLFYDSDIKELERQPALRYPPAAEVKNVYRAMVNYLQVPAGSGEGLYFDFDLNDFIKKFKLDILTATYSLRILEQEDIISYSQQSYIPSTVVFTANKDVLREMELSHPEFDPVIKGLLRSYEGIIDYPAPISEGRLATFLKISEESLIDNLKRLQSFGVIQYSPQKDKPQLCFLHNRVNTQDLTFNTNNINKRKAAFESRLNAMIDYVKKLQLCRSRMIGFYFNDHAIRPCRICDNCINEKNLVISKEEFEEIAASICTLVEKSPVTANELLLRLAMFNKNKVWKIINYMQQENKIVVKRDGVIIRLL